MTVGELPHQVNYTKFVPPRDRRRFVSRARLIDLMEASSQDKITLVYAPEGYGKTSLVANWFHNSVSKNENVKSLWFRVDEHDQDPLCFWSNLVAAMESCWPGIAEAIAASMDALDTSSPLQLIIALANYVVRNSEDPLQYLLVFDNYERFCLSESENQLTTFIEMVPDNVRIVIATQKFPSNRLIEADSYSSSTLIGASELSITAEELRDVMAKNGVAPNEEQLLLLDKATEGWPLAIHVVLEEFQKGCDFGECLLNLSSNSVALAEAMFEKTVEELPAQARAFLLKTGFFEELSAEMCDYALENDSSDDFIRFLARNGTFIFPLNERNGTYRYHALFAEWLRNKALSSLPEEEIRTINHRVAYWHHQQGNWAQAGKHAIAASEGTFVVDLTKVVFKHSRKTEDDLLSWIFDYRAAEISNRPFFCVMAAWTYVFFGRPEEAGFWIQRAKDALPGKSASNEVQDCKDDSIAQSGDGLMRRLAQVERTIKAKVLVLEGRYADGAHAINAIRTIEGKNLDARLLMVLDQSLGEAREMDGNLDGAMQCYRSALVQARVLEYDFLVSFIRYQIARVNLMRGEVTTAYDLCAEAIESCPPDFTVYGALKGLVSRIHTHHGESDDSQHALQQAFATVSADRNLDMYLDVCVSYIEFALAKSDYSDALYQATVALQAMANSGYTPPRGTAVQVFAKQAQSFALMGDGNSAQAAIDARPSRGYRDTEEGRFLDALALAPLAERSPDSARATAERLETLAADARGKDYILHELSLSVALVRLWHVAGFHEKALRSLRNALDIARPGKLVQPLLNGGEIVEVLLTESVGSRQSDYGYIKFARSVLAAFSSAAEEAPLPDLDASASSLPDGITPDDLSYMEHWGLTMRELDVLRLLMRGVKRKGIAAELCTSDNTVKTHIAHIYEKMDAHSVPELLRRVTEFQSA